MWGQLVSLGIGVASNMYNGYQEAKSSRKLIAIRKRTEAVLAGAALATTMNAATRQSTEITRQAKRAEFGVLQATVQAKGAAVAQAAATGAAGKRVTLAIEQETSGKEDQRLALIKADTAAAQDAILNNMEASYKKTVSDILSGPVDVPKTYSPGGDIMKGIISGADIVLEHRESTKGFELKRKTQLAQGG